MGKAWLVGCVVAVMVMGIAAQAMARDVYVSITRGQNKGGDGTIASPYKNIAWAAKQAQPGDVIHIAAGHYPGEGRSGHWVVETNNLTFMGGYNEEFTTRDPFNSITLLAWDDSPDNTYKRSGGPEFQAVKDGSATQARCLSGITLDGLTFDGGPRNTYDDKPEDPSLMTDRTPNDSLVFLAMEQGSVGVVRNCTFLNPGVSPCIIAQSRPGGRIEIYNNAFVNSVQHQIDLTCKTDKQFNRADFEIHHNTFLFSWKTSSGGSGIYVRENTNVNAHHNIIAFGDDNAVSNQFYERKVDERGVPKTGLMNENVHMDDNLLFMWKRGLYGWVNEGQSGLLAAVSLDELSDTSLASAKGNVVAHPAFEYNEEWMTRFLNRPEAADGRVTADAIAALRTELGLSPDLFNDQKSRQYCVRYPLADVMKLRAPQAPEAQGKGASMALMTQPPGAPAMPPP
jgi:hypothetical protein